jgi:NAD-dependent dihydropyrimidine dehydrogenase PreA subunit
MRAEGIFIAVEVDAAAADDAELAKRLTEACPVDIFAERDGGVAIVEGNLDECVLCRLCLDAAAAHDRGGRDAVRVIKRYDGDAVLA